MVAEGNEQDTRCVVDRILVVDRVMQTNQAPGARSPGFSLTPEVFAWTWVRMFKKAIATRAAIESPRYLNSTDCSATWQLQMFKSDA